LVCTGDGNFVSLSYIYCREINNGRAAFMHFVYMLKCRDGSLYTGWTTDVKRRLREHNSGRGAKCTRARLPVTLLYSESFQTKKEAMRREYYIKQLTREEKLELVRASVSIGKDEKLHNKDKNVV
jgi:putative endonuclease